ncbi:MAG TPA: PBP1A family penicillin-binding protein [Candidatus Acidoferrales bacterium]|jgi:penicillin-binding protein 1A|nr:PBP1A family penicillin-binding protein [Candidatus Acidoferrales bacterium]
MKFPFSDLPGFELAGRRVVGRVVLVLLVLTAALAGTLVGLLIVYSTDLPQISELEKYRPSTITELYDSRGRIIGQFALQRRVIAQYNDFPKVLRDAILSTEDKSFERHWGINFWRVMGATWRDIQSNRKAEGASTLTMQLSRNLFLSPERHFSRKIQEAMLAIQIERHFTKEQIFTLYANQIFLGSGVYGFEAGSEYYFSKPARELKLEEAALLAGLPKAPVSLSPINFPERAIKRRNLVINNMLEDGKITAAEANRAKAAPLRLNLAPEVSPAPYFVEEVRRQLEKKFGPDQVHEGGLRVYTSLNLDLQRAAQQSVLDGLAAYERRHGWKGHLRNVVREDEKVDRWQDPDWQQPVAPGTYMHGLVVNVEPKLARIKLGRLSAQIGPAEIQWTKAKLPRMLLSVGDVVYVKVLAVSSNGTARVSLEQESGVQGALLAIDNATGDIKAMVGGRDYDESKFNRAIQAQRQTGSSFKPFVYTAAIDRGAQPDDKILDEPTTFDSAGTPYTPHNFDHRFEGLITLRHALAESRNVPAVKLAQQLGMPTVTEYARRFGITSQLPPFLPVALGAADLTLYEQTAAFTVFPNDGIRIEPRLITKVTDYDGHVLEEDYPDARDVTSSRTARIMVSLLQGVVQHGTAIAARKLNHPLAGKTGTTNDYTDAWFIGFSPSLTCGVWVGYDERKTLGENETGGRAALPIWMDFMRAALADPALRQEAFLPLPGAGRKAVVKSAAVTLPKPAGDVMRR